MEYKLKQLDNSLFSNTKTITMNFGPQHPAAHGVLRLLTVLDGEIVRNVDAHIGLLHRGTEKLIEHKTYTQAIPYFDRLDYVSMMAQEHTFALAVENVCGARLPYCVSASRVIFLELTRILNHILAITTHALDIGAITPFFWGFEERERLMEFYERVSGARMHAAFIRPGGINKRLDCDLVDDIFKFCNDFEAKILDFTTLLSKNRVWCLRLTDVGVVTPDAAKALGFTGVMLRGAGIPWDLRKNATYECYDIVPFKVPVSSKGDCYARFLVRMSEMYESLHIIKRIIREKRKPFCPLKKNPITTSKRVRNGQMELVINHFKSKTNGFDSLEHIPRAAYAGTEAPKGEFGIFIIPDKTNSFSRCKIRAPGFSHLQSLNFMAKDHTLADLVAIIGTQDIVFGEVDR